MRLDSRTAIYCHELLHMKYAPNAFPGLTPDEPDPVVEEFKNLGFSHEAKAIAALKVAYPDLIEIDQSKSLSEIEMDTVKALLDPNSSIISGAYIAEIAEKELAKAFGIPFAPTERASRPDLMIKLGTNSDGRPYWVPVDIKSHKAVTESKSNSVLTSSISDGYRRTLRCADCCHTQAKCFGHSF